MSGSPTETIEAAFADIWQRNLPLIYRRIAAVEQAAVELAKPSPDPERIDLGFSEAHDLVGVLGTFGLAQGSGLAQKLEERLGGERANNASDPVRLAAELRALVDGTLVDPGAQDADRQGPS